jgi:hypothetical protein
MKTSIIVFITSCLIILPSILWAQGFMPFMPNNPEQAPIDGGLGILAAIGGAYAIKKLRDKE